MSSCAVVVLPGQPEHGQAAKARTGTQIAARGCRKATPGTVRSHGEPGQALEEVSRPPGAGETAPRLPSTAPASRRFIRADTRGLRASGRNGAWPSGWPAQNCAPRGRSCWKHASGMTAEFAALAGKRGCLPQRADGAYGNPHNEEQDCVFRTPCLGVPAVINDVQTPYLRRPAGLDSMAVIGTNHASTNFLAGPFAAAKRGV
jgi:hypothetical protein